MTAMELRQLRNFLQICRSGSLSRAATVLNIAQPALSRQIRELEAELGVQLFYRHGRGLAPTAAGERFLRSLEPVLRDLDAAYADIASVRDIPAGKVVLAAPPSVMAVIAADMASHFSSQHPQVELQLVDGFSGYLFEWLMEGRADITILNGARKAANLAVEPLGATQLHFAGSTTAGPAIADLLAKKRVAFKDLKDVPLILPSMNHGLRREVERIAAENDVRLNILFDVDSLAAQREILRQGMAGTLIAPAVISIELAMGVVSSAKVVEPGLSHRYVLAVPTERPISAAMEIVCDYLRAWGRNLEQDQI